MGRLRAALIAVENKLHAMLVRFSIPLLRVAVGGVFLGFGALKFFPGISPAENLSRKTIELLTLGLVPGRVGIIAIAVLECFIGICLLANRWMRVAVWLLALEGIGILAPLALLPDRLFSGPHNAPTLEGQYVLKDIIGLPVVTEQERTLSRGGGRRSALARFTQSASVKGAGRLAIEAAGTSASIGAGSWRRSWQG